MLRGLSKASNAQLAHFRTCMASSVARGEHEKTEMMSALLNHSAATSLQVYDISNRRVLRMKAVEHAVRWLRSEIPKDFTATPGEAVKDGDITQPTQADFHDVGTSAAQENLIPQGTATGPPSPQHSGSIEESKHFKMLFPHYVEDTFLGQHEPRRSTARTDNT